MGMESVFRLSVVMGIVDKLTPKLPGVENGVSGALQNINNGFGAMQKAEQHDRGWNSNTGSYGKTGNVNV